MVTSFDTVFDVENTPTKLGKEIGNGGEGSVYEVPANTDAVVKIYRTEKLLPQTLDKINKMRVMPIRNENFVSWPFFPVFDSKRNWVGYAMRKAEGVPAIYLAHAVLYKKYFPDLDRKAIVKYLIALVKQVESLHRQGIMIGDYNLNNIFFLPKTNKVFFIDCDSYQIPGGFRCPVGSPDMTPKEHQGRSFSDINRTIESELFSLAIILFKCLMLGRHPYDVVGGADPVENLRDGKFPYGKGRGGRDNIPKGDWYNIWSHMPHRIKNLFITTFTDGANDSSKRATTQEWLDALVIYDRELKKGFHALEIRPKEPKSNDYNGGGNGNKSFL